jgi:ribosome-associated protein
MADKKATNSSVLELKDISAFTDYFVICSASSPQQMRAIAEGVQEKLKAHGIRMEHQEGVWDSAWILLDYGEFIVHIFEEEARLFYNLEELWHNAVRLEF